LGRSLADPAFVLAGAAATAAIVFIHEFKFVLAKVEVSRCAGVCRSKRSPLKIQSENK
jgi:hypothetical protein